MSELTCEKADIRRRLLAARRAFPGRADAQTALDGVLLEPGRPWFAPRLRSVAVYDALVDEASIRRLVHRLEGEGVHVAFPRVEGDRLAFAVTPPAALVPAPFGLREPPPEIPETPPEALDLFLVPGVGFDRSGGRIGYGRGYYDRALTEAGPRALRIGVAFDRQVEPRIPLEAHDVRLDGLVTESGFAWRPR